MIAGIRIKICGLTSVVDAEAADACGADCLGFIFHPASPRAISLARYAAMARRLPGRSKVAVCVEPTSDELAAMKAAAFDFFQIHFRHDFPLAAIEKWSHAVGAANLWLAPKLPPGSDAAAEWLSLAGTVLMDTFQAEVFGGSGRTGDWDKFVRHQEAHPEITWILSGGLNPQNIAEAIRRTGARLADVNSGVESAPGIKDAGKLHALAAALREGAGRLPLQGGGV